MSRDRWLLLFSVLAVWVIWGSTYFAIRITLESMPPFRMAALRLGLAGAILVGVGWLRGTRLPTRAEWLACARVGGLLFLGGNGSVVYAEQTVSSGLVAILVGAVPLWTVIIGRFFGATATLRQWAGILLGVSGVALLNLGGELGGNPLMAMILLLGSAGWALGSVLGHRWPMPSGTMASGAQMIVGAGWLALASLVTGEQQLVEITARSWACFVYLLTFGSLIAFSAYGYLLKNASLPLATSYAYVNPVVAVLLGVFLGNELFGWREASGLVIILGGVLLINLARYRSSVRA